MTELVEVCNPSAIWSIPGVNMLEARGERTAMEAMVATLSILVVWDQFLGFSGSFFVNVRSSRSSAVSVSESMG